ncbi:hypothetical protein F2Q69_00026241 [Brassica cretica]|uniref:Uncharacterized protein n=1 Tax=Brassica cretica TaxID=69181 RepID=A0A8S9S518_BRACR|nr:hypothetical protein F2Q69_00026241 [Brassica cretica]
MQQSMARKQFHHHRTFDEHTIPRKMSRQLLQTGVQDSLCDFDNSCSNDIPLLQLDLGPYRGGRILAANSLLPGGDAHLAEKD